MEIKDVPIPLFKTPNFELTMGEGNVVRFYFNEKKTLLKRIKWWLFCQFFPFKIVKWDKE